MEHLKYLGEKYLTWSPVDEYQVWETWKERNGDQKDLSVRKISRHDLESVLDNDDLFRDSREIKGPKIQLLVASHILSVTRGNKATNRSILGIKNVHQDFREAMGEGTPPHQELVDKATHMPFDRRVFRKVSAQIGMPPAYFMQLFRKHAVTFLRANVSRDGKRLKGFICQTPFLTDSDFFISLAVSYDPETFQYRGVLHFLLDEYRYDSIRHYIFATRHLVQHPLLLPVIIFNVADTHNRLQYRRVDSLVGISLVASNASTQASGTNLEHFAQSLDESSKWLRRLQSYQVALAGSLSNFLQTSQKVLSDAFQTLDSPDLDPVVKDELHEYSDNIGLDTAHQLATRTGLELQIQQALTRMEHEHTRISLRQAQYSKQDAAVMGVISVITMIFLPATALATIFSMSIFFDTTPDGAGVTVTKSFWVFVVVAAALTLVIVCGWVYWTWDNRRKKKGVAGRSWGGWNLFVSGSGGRVRGPDQEAGLSTGTDVVMPGSTPAPRDRKLGYSSLFPTSISRSMSRGDKETVVRPDVRDERSK